MAVDDVHNDDCLEEDAPPNGERVNGGGSVMEILTRVELDLAYFSEKLLNLEILLMEVAGRANDIESLVLDNDGVSDDSVEKAFKFDILSGILDSEVKELDSFMTSLQMEISDAHEKLSGEESSEKMEEKLHQAEMSLKQFQDLVADIRRESVKFENAICYIWSKSWTGEDGGAENGHLSFRSAKWKMQTEDQQRHILQMLEKSLARELDLEKQLSDSRSVEEELKLKLHNAERESYFQEESIDMIIEKTLEAENVSMLFLGISKELVGRLNTVQFDLNASMLRENELRSKLQDSIMKLSAEESSRAELDNIVLLQENGLKGRLKEAEDRCVFASSEVSSLREKVLSLEEQLKGSNNQLSLAKGSAEAGQEEKKMLHSELVVLENVIKSLKESNSKTESRAESAEAQCSELTKANMKLNEELQVLRNHGSEKANSLGRKLNESDTQLEHAKASLEAIVEEQRLLKSTVSDMEHMIEDFKAKVSKAETRAENAESKCTVLTETNLELNEELGFLRSKVETLENSLSHADHAKVSTAKDIGIRTKIIVDLVRKLALEREQLHLQISALTRKNKMLAQKYKRDDYAGTTFSQKGTDKTDQSASAKLSAEPLTESSSTNIQVKSVPVVPNDEIEIEAAVFADDSSVVDSSLGTVRTIEPTQLNWKYLLTAILVSLVSYVVYCMYQEESTVA